MMTSLFDVIEHDENHLARQQRKATVVAKARVEDHYGPWIRQDAQARRSHLSQEIADITRQACAEYGITDSTTMGRIESAVHRGYVVHEPKTASTEHESARLPKMCPFHKDVVNISLAQGDPSAGFSALAPHWGGERHCESEGFKGEKCKFKPQMTTQSYWDERQEKAEQRRQEREQAAELEAQQQTEETEAVEEFEAPLEQELEVPTDDNVVEVDFGGGSGNEPSAEAEVPMSMAAGVHHTAPGGQHVPGASDKENRQYEHIKKKYLADGKSEEEAKELAARTVNKQKDSATGDDKTGLGDAEPKMDKGKWVPKAPEGLDDAKGRNPSEMIDIAEPIKADNEGTWPPPGIGKQMTERVDVTQNKDDAVGTGGTFKGGPTTAVSAVADDPYAGNPILDLIENEYDGFTPQSTVDQAIVASRRR